MSRQLPFLEAHPKRVPVYSLERNTGSPGSNDLLHGPNSPSHAVERKEKGHIRPPGRRGGLPAPSQAWPVEHCTLWCINICLWLKFKQPCVAARHNRKPSSAGKCLLQGWPKQPLPAKRPSDWPGPPRCYHTGPRPRLCPPALPPGPRRRGSPPFWGRWGALMHTQPFATVHTRPSDMLMVLRAFLHSKGPEWAKPPGIPAPTTAKHASAPGNYLGGAYYLFAHTAAQHRWPFSGPVSLVHLQFSSLCIL